MAVAGPLAVLVGVGCERVLLVGSAVGVQLSVLGEVRRSWGDVRLSGPSVGSADVVAALGERHESEMPVGRRAQRPGAREAVAVQDAPSCSPAQPFRWYWWS